MTPEKSHGVVVRFIDPGPGRRILNFIAPFVYLQVCSSGKWLARATRGTPGTPGTSRSTVNRRLQTFLAVAVSTTSSILLTRRIGDSQLWPGRGGVNRGSKGVADLKLVTIPTLGSLNPPYDNLLQNALSGPKL